MTDDWRHRLTNELEPILALPDPRPKLSAYHDLPYAIFQYSPEHEFAVRAEITNLGTRLGNQSGKTVTRISLAECLTKALAEEAPINRLAGAVVTGRWPGW